VRVFVAGATGILGRRVVARLAAAGHEVVGASRSAKNDEQLRALGATPRACDVLDADSATRAAEGCEAVLHLATAIPMKQRTSAADWAANDRLRRDGTRALLAAARAHGALIYVQQSVCWVYGGHGDAWVDEATPRAARQALVIQSAADMEALVEGAGLPAVILRLGAFYGADSSQTRGMVELFRAGKMHLPGDGAAWQSLIHVDDAAAAVVLAATDPARAADKTWNVVDDEPVRWRTLGEHLAAAVGQRLPGTVPGFLVRLALGRPTSEVLSQSLRVRNARARAELGFAPAYPTFREGFAQVLAALDGSSGVRPEER
jgi:nucleoside-diphosphate-sugar epimerase